MNCECRCSHCNFKWFEGGFLQRLVQFCCYLLVAAVMFTIFYGTGLMNWMPQ